MRYRRVCEVATLQIGSSGNETNAAQGLTL